MKLDVVDMAACMWYIVCMDFDVAASWGVLCQNFDPSSVTDNAPGVLFGVSDFPQLIFVSKVCVGVVDTVLYREIK